MVKSEWSMVNGEWSMVMKKLFASALIACVTSAACGGSTDSAQPASGSSAPVPAASMPKIEAQPILDHIKILASDEFEGRAPGTPGEDKTVAYLVEQFKQLGLKPGNSDGTYTQKVPLVGIQAANTQPLTVTKG